MSTSKDPKDSDNNSVVTGRPGGPKLQAGDSEDLIELSNDEGLNEQQLEQNDEVVQ